MITDEDTTKIANKVIEANKLLFYTKDELDSSLDQKFSNLRQDFSNLQSVVIAFAKATKSNSDVKPIVAPDRYGNVFFTP